MARKMVFVALAAACLLGCGPTVTGIYTEQIDTSKDPTQEEIQAPQKITLSKRGWEMTLTPLAAYDIKGIVVHRENYSSGWNSLVSPCDVAMVWKHMAENDIFKKVSWSQSGRWYYWETGDSFPYDNSFIARYSSNTHIIPASDNLSRAAKSLGRWDVAELSGDLVRVDATKGSEPYWWVSSLSRQDTGDGSCEILYLKHLKKDNKEYE